MKKLALLIVTAVFVSGLSAQTFTPAKELKEPIKSNAIGVMPKLFPEKKAYEPMGWIYSYSFLGNLLPSSYNLGSKRTTIPLFPDSCLNYVYQYPDSLNEFSISRHSIGCSFDPYSESYDKMFMSGIFPTPNWPAVVTYPYVIDAVNLIGTYFWGEKEGGFNPNSPDTLRLYFTYYKVYERIGVKKEWQALNYISDKNGDTALFSPMITFNPDDPKNSKGNSLRPIATNTFVMDYILQAGDSSRVWDSIVDNEGKMDTMTFYSFKSYEITLPNGGFEVPAGAVVSCIAKFIPGFQYHVGDTLEYANVKPDNTLDGDLHRYHNMFSLIVFNEDSKHAKAFCDPYGYNTSFFEHKYTHYQMWLGSDGKPNTLYNSMYYPTHQLTWYMQYHFGYDSLAAVEVCDSAIWHQQHPDTTGPGVKEANSIIESIYPNPASDYVVVSLKNNDQAAIRIVNVMGQVMKTVYTTEEKNRISTKDLSAGIYFLSVEQNGKRYSTKLTIR